MEDSLSSSVELISASPSPERAAPDRTRILTWHTPRQPAPSTGPAPDSDSDSDAPDDGRRQWPSPALALSDVDSPDTSASRSQPRSPIMISDDDDEAAAPPVSERRRPRPLVISDDEVEDDDTIPCSQQRLSDTARPGRRSEDVVEASFEGEKSGSWRAQCGTSAATARDDASAAASNPADAATSDHDGNAPDAVITPTGQGGDISAASLIGSDESWDGTSMARTRSSEDVCAEEDSHARAQRLYSKYTIKKRTAPPAQSSQVGDGQTSIRQAGADSTLNPPSRQRAGQSPDGRAEPCGRQEPAPLVDDRAPRCQQPSASAGRAEQPPCGVPQSRTVFIVPTKMTSAPTKTTSGVAQGSAEALESSCPEVSPETSLGNSTEGRPRPAGATQASCSMTGRNGSAGTATASPLTQESQDTAHGMNLSFLSIHELEQQLKQKEMVARVSNLSALPDGGRRLRATIHQLRTALEKKRSGYVQPADPRPASATNSGGGSSHSSSSSMRRGDGDSGGGGGSSRLQQCQAQLRQKKMEYSTNAHWADAAHSAQLQRDIFRLETEMMKLQMAGDAAGLGGRNPFSLNSTVCRPPPLNRPRGEAGQRLGPPPAGPDFFPASNNELEAALRRGEPTTTTVTEEQRRLEAEARESLRDFGQIRPQLTAALLASNPELSRLYGGRMTEARHRQVSNVTTDVLERLHRSLETLPPPSAAEAGPACLNVPLMPHQQYALSWLQWRERQLPAGGILADDMGLGKTLTMIAHCLRVVELDKEAAEKEKDGGNKENTEKGNPEREKDGERQPETEEVDFANSKGGKWLSKSKPAQEKGTAPSLPPSEATLVICPASVLLQWEAEVNRRTTASITTIVYHGPNRRADQRRLRKADFVLTTYDLVRQEVEKSNLIGANPACPSPLMSFRWRRIILDEAHQIRNRNTKSSKAVCELQAVNRWLLSGTPIQNGREDFFSLMRFLRAAPFHEYEVWKRWIDKSPRGDERLSLIVRTMVLRRTKDQMSPATGKPLVALPPQEKRNHTVELDKREREVYDKVFEFCRSSLQEFIKLQEQREYEKELKTNCNARPPPGLTGIALSASVATAGMGSDGSAGGPSGLGERGSIKQHHLLVQLLRLRQICCHPGLAKTVMTSSDRESAGVDAEDTADLETQLMGLSLNETAAQVTGQASVLSADNPVFSRDWRSAKLRGLMQEVQAIVDAGKEKLVIVSQWTSMLDIVREHLSAARVPSCTISGSVKMSERQDLIDAFNGSSGRGPRVMLLSLLAGGVGLNLVGGNHLFILDPHWNPQLEEQAGDRIYRVGQRRSVFIHRFVCKDTLEERILELQQKKLNIARGVLSGDKQASSNRLTMSDLKTLFNVQ